MPKRSPKEYAREARARVRAAGRVPANAYVTQETLEFWKDRAIESGATLPVLLGDVLNEAIFKVTVVKPYVKPTAELAEAVAKEIMDSKVLEFGLTRRLWMADISRRLVRLSTGNGARPSLKSPRMTEPTEQQSNDMPTC